MVTVTLAAMRQKDFFLSLITNSWFHDTGIVFKKKHKKKLDSVLCVKSIFTCSDFQNMRGNLILSKKSEIIENHYSGNDLKQTDHNHNHTDC